jgi:amidohydrolase
MDLAPVIAPFLPEIVALRHDLHAHPELSGHEERTARTVSQLLTRHGIAHETGVGGGHGIVATIDSGKPGRTIALRGDMDALPIQEERDSDYKSTVPGVMHACGHDGHTANLVGAGLALNALKERFSGRVRMLFQPAEETVSGAASIIDGGGLDGVDAIVMLHGWPDLPAGVVGIRTGPVMASSDSWKLTIHGKGGHAAYPHKTIDPVFVGAQVVTALQGIVAREVAPTAPAVVTVAAFHAGTAHNVIAQSAMLKGTVRTLDPELRDTMPQRLERVIGGVCAAFRATYTFDYHRGTPPVVNDAGIADLIRVVTIDTLGADRLVELSEPTMGAEDFAFYLERIPGAMFRLGTGCPYLLHTPKYDFGDAPLPAGIAVMTGVALRFLAG